MPVILCISSSCISVRPFILNDLKYQEALLELERGYKINKKDIIEFVAELIKGDRNDKEYQQKIIDNRTKKGRMGMDLLQLKAS